MNLLLRRPAMLADAVRWAMLKTRRIEPGARVRNGRTARGDRGSDLVARCGEVSKEEELE